MTDADAIRLVQMLAAAFRQDVSEETAIQWAADLREFELSDGLEAVSLARQTQVYMPSLAELRAIIRDCRNVRVVMRPALPSVQSCCQGQWFGHFYRDHATETQRASVDALIAKAKDAPKKDERVVLEAFLELVGR